MGREFLYLYSIHPYPTSWGYPLSILPLSHSFRGAMHTQGRQAPSLLWGKEGMSLGAIHQGNDMAIHLGTTKPHRKSLASQMWSTPVHHTTQASQADPKSAFGKGVRRSLNLKAWLSQKSLQLGSAEPFFKTLGLENGNATGLSIPHLPQRLG